MIRFILYFSPPKRLPPRVIVVVCTIGKKHKFTNITGVIRFGDEAGAGSSVGHNRVLLGFYAVWGQNVDTSQIPCANFTKYDCSTKI